MDSCPYCGATVEPVGCEKTTHCDGCGRDLCLKYDDFGQESLVEVGDDFVWEDR